MYGRRASDKHELCVQARLSRRPQQAEAAPREIEDDGVGEMTDDTFDALVKENTEAAAALAAAETVEAERMRAKVCPAHSRCRQLRPRLRLGCWRSDHAAYICCCGYACMRCLEPRSLLEPLSQERTTIRKDVLANRVAGLLAIVFAIALVRVVSTTPPEALGCMSMMDVRALGAADDGKAAGPG